MCAPCKYARTLSLPILLIFLSACSGLFPAPAGTPSPNPTATASPTIAWFPATVTPTFSPTVVLLPTEDLRPGQGETLLSDGFEDASLWSTSLTQNTSVVVDRGRITLNVRPGFFTLSLRNDLMLTDFYAEIHASLNLCRGADAYGLIVRAIGTVDYYRFAVNCNGQVRPERVHNGQLVPLQDWLPSGDAPTGAPGESVLGVWAAGGELRFFLNGRFQFTVRDPVFLYGSVGVFVLSNGSTEETVSFSDLVITRVTYASPTPTVTSSPTPTATRLP